MSPFCAMCRRMVINAGIVRVVIRKTPTEFEIVDVAEWVEGDDLPFAENIGG